MSNFKSFKKMILMDHEDEVKSVGGFATANKSKAHKTYNIRDNKKVKQPSKIDLIEFKMYTIEKQIQNLLKNKKIRDDDKLMFLSELLRRHSSLIELKRNQILINNRQIIEQVQQTNDEPKRFTQKESSHNTDASDIYSLQKTPPPSQPLRSSLTKANEATTQNVFPRKLDLIDFDDDDDDDDEDDDDENESIYENANSFVPMDIDSSNVLEDDKNVLAKFIPNFKQETNPLLNQENIASTSYLTPSNRYGKKRRALTPLQSVMKNKLNKVPKLSGIIKKWDLRPTETRLRMREQLLLQPTKKKPTKH